MISHSYNLSKFKKPQSERAGLQKTGKTSQNNTFLNYSTYTPTINLV